MANFNFWEDFWHIFVHASIYTIFEYQMEIAKQSHRELPTEENSYEIRAVRRRVSLSPEMPRYKLSVPQFERYVYTHTRYFSFHFKMVVANTVHVCVTQALHIRSL